MLNSTSRTYLACCLVLFGISCAQVRSLSGGEKDTKAPVVLMAYPAPFSTYFDKKTITLEFDEYIQLNDIHQELVVSPPMQKQATIKVKHKSVVIQLNESLLPNTTYVFNFGDGVVDVNEGNKATDLMYVLSTGDNIDSLEIHGNIHDAFNDIPAKDMKVLLYENDTSIFSKKSTPLYLGRTKEGGSFGINYMRDGAFFLYALDDQNSNYRWDEGEAIAMSGAPVHPAISDSVNHQLYSSIPRLEKPNIGDYKTDSIGSIKFALENYFDSLQIISAGGLEIITDHSNDSMSVWFKGKPTNKNEIIAISWKDVFHDTVEVPFYDSKLRSFLLQTSITQKMKSDEIIKIFSTSPLYLNNTAKVIFMLDSATLPFKMNASKNGIEHLFESNKLPGKNYSIQFLPGAFVNEAGSTNDSLTLKFSTYKTEELGTLKLNISSVNELVPSLLTLSDKFNEIVYSTTIRKSGVIDIGNLPAGEYTAKMIVDTNQNNVWDPIDFTQKKTPEKLHVYPGKIAIRSNWEVKIDWKLQE